jgi:hypothetical protein
MPGMPRARGLSPKVSLPLGLAVLLACACGPSEKKIKAWKIAPDGAAKLAAVVKNSKARTDLRAQAAVGLVESGAGDEMAAALAGLDIDERNRLALLIVPLLDPTLRSTDEARSGDARDALYSLRELAVAALPRKAVDAALFPGLVADVKSGRGRVGRREVRDMLVGIGPPMVPLLLPLLEDPNVPFATIVEVVDKVGDAAARASGGAGLVRRAKKVTVMADPLWDAMATLGGKDVAQFLIDTVDKEAAPQAERAAKAMMLLAPDATVAEFVVRRAGQGTTTPTLREQLFAVAEKNRGPECRRALLDLIGKTLDPAIRYRAYRAALKAAGGAVIPDALAAFPGNVRFRSDEVRTELVGPISAMPGMDTRGPLFKSMESPVALARLVALLAIEKMGFASDATHVAKLQKDTGRVPGLPAEDQVGRQATRIAAALRKIPS